MVKGGNMVDGKTLTDSFGKIASALANNYTIMLFEELPVLRDVTDVTSWGYRGGAIEGLNEIVYAEDQHGRFHEIGYRSYKKRKGEEPLQTVNEIEFDPRTGRVTGYISGDWVEKPLWDRACERSGAFNALFDFDIYGTRPRRKEKQIVEEPDMLRNVAMADSLKYIRTKKPKKLLGTDQFGRRIYASVIKSTEGLGEYEFGRYVDPRGYDSDLIKHYLKQRILYKLISIPFVPIEHGFKLLNIPPDILITEKYELIGGGASMN